MKTGSAVVSASLLYATLRYNVFKGVPWEEWPTYVVNKAAALSALLLAVIFLVRLRGRRGAGQARLQASIAGLIAFHVTLSLALLGPATYPKFFVDGKPVAAVAWSLLLGAAAAAGALLHALRTRAPSDPGRPRVLGLLAFAPGLHAAMLGYEGWFAPSAWPGFLVPITLIAFVAGTIGLLAGAWPVGVARRRPDDSRQA